MGKKNKNKKNAKKNGKKVPGHYRQQYLDKSIMEIQNFLGTFESLLDLLLMQH